MTKNFIKIFTLILFLLYSIANISCKKSVEENGNQEQTGPQKVTLTVFLSEGITGTPSTGTYEYNSGDTINYTYISNQGYKQPFTSLNDSQVPNSGSFQINDNSLLSSNTGYIDVRGKWSGDFIWYEWEARTYPKDVVFFTVHFSGDLQSGKTKGMFLYKDFWWGRGPFSIVGDQITFKIEYWDDSWLLCKGTIKSETEMEGNWYFWSPWGFFPEGTFKLNFKGSSASTDEIPVGKKNIFGSKNPFMKN